MSRESVPNHRYGRWIESWANIFCDQRVVDRREIWTIFGAQIGRSCLNGHSRTADPNEFHSFTRHLGVVSINLNVPHVSNWIIHLKLKLKASIVRSVQHVVSIFLLVINDRTRFSLPRCRNQQPWRYFSTSLQLFQLNERKKLKKQQETINAMSFTRKRGEIPSSPFKRSFFDWDSWLATY